MEKKIIKQRTSDLNLEIKKEIDRLIDIEFGNVTIVQQHSWSIPDWTIILLNEKKELLTFYRIVLREVLFDQEKVKVAGINNVITPPAFRGNGYATKILNDSKDFLFNELEVDFGLLLCAKNLVPFYEKLGWHEINSLVYFDQTDGKRKWKACAMLLSKNDLELNPGTIDLMGYPW